MSIPPTLYMGYGTLFIIYLERADLAYELQLW